MSEENELGGSYTINEAGEKVLTHRTGYVAPVIAPPGAVAEVALRVEQTDLSGKKKWFGAASAAAKDQPTEEEKA